MTEENKHDEQDERRWEEERTRAFLKSQLTSFFDAEFKKNGTAPATRPTEE